ncbi:MAG: phosphatase PAP2 family protein [Candidatus Eremiobacteraeota bacterium]|nr:phosphatase PAP2 family protein [Candidatus Eremiobacteraeota bacterium]
MTLESRLWIAAAVAIIAFVALGAIVSRQPPMRLDVEAGATRGAATQLAIVFTQSGRFWPLIALACAGTLLFAIARWPLWIPLVILVSQITSQGLIELAKRSFGRPRPDDWLFHHELGYSYPSGHACTALVFFGAYALALCAFPISRGWKIAILAVALFWILGIDWSRVALGAHYLTDVIGGTLFGIAWLCAIAALVLRLVAHGRLTV